MINSTFFDNIDVEGKAYWLGFFYADGCLYSNGTTACILLSANDDIHLVKFAEIFGLPIKRETTYHKKEDKYYKSVRCMLYSKHLCDSLLAKGVTSRKTETATDEIFQYIPENLLHHFVRGYFDGDGHIGAVAHAGKSEATEHRFVVCGTKIFLSALGIILANRLGVRLHVPYQSPGVYKISLGGARQLSKIRDWLYKDATIYLERKKIQFDKVPEKRGSSRYNGVYWQKLQNKWIARLFLEGEAKHRYIGCYDLEEDAALAYDELAKQYYGVAARLNFPVGMDANAPAMISEFIKGGL